MYTANWSIGKTWFEFWKCVLTKNTKYKTIAEFYTVEYNPQSQSFIITLGPLRWFILVYIYQQLSKAFDHWILISAKSKEPSSHQKYFMHTSHVVGTYLIHTSHVVGTYLIHTSHVVGTYLIHTSYVVRIWYILHMWYVQICKMYTFLFGICIN
jgi:hypothetical protein